MRFIDNKDNQVITVDISDNCDFKCNLEMEKLPFEDNSVEIIFCFNVLEHIYNHKNVINEVYRVLKPNGKFYMSVPFLLNKHADPYDFYRYTDTTLDRLHNEVGFKKLNQNTLHGAGKVAHQTLSWIYSNGKLSIVGKFINIIFGLFFTALDKTLNYFNHTKKINKAFVITYFMEYQK
jgi:ubiquinone/menaquinone biosynthesis C-methylase UbiE